MKKPAAVPAAKARPVSPPAGCWAAALPAVFAMVLWPAAMSAAAAAAERPNFLVVLADDLGYGDLGCYGHPRLKTPRLDRFARGGLRLTDCYSAAPNCSPARTGLMTGRTPARVGVYNWIPMHSPMHVRREEVTVATLLQAAGYDTCHVGKWHLNGAFNHDSQPQPDDHGFDHWFATQNNALPNHRNPDNFVRNGKPVGQLRGYSAQLVADEAVRWLEGRGGKRPFFLFVCFHEPHEPIATDQRFAGLYPGDDPSLSAHHGNISQLDEGFGRLLDALDRLRLRDDTLILFTSDNGPARTAIHPHGSSGGLRDKKGYVYEGGIRVPGIVQWPGHVTPGSVSDSPVGGVDLLPTLCQLAGVDPPPGRTLDGVSVAPLLRGEQFQRSRPLYWQFHRARGDIKVALRQGDWKIAAELTSPTPKPSGEIAAGETEALKKAELKNFRLFHLEADPAEQTDVQRKHPQEFQRLRELLIETHADVRAEQPLWPAWEWPRYESQRIEWPAYWQRKKQPGRGK